MTSLYHFEPDELDRALIAALREDGRLSHTALGRGLGTSNVTVRNRLQRLIDHKVLRVVPRIDPTAFGFTIPVLLLIRARPRDVERLADLLGQDGSVHSVKLISGRFDLAVEASFRDHDGLTRFLRGLNQADGVQEVQSSHVLETLKGDGDWRPEEPATEGGGLAAMPAAEDGRPSMFWPQLNRGDGPDLDTDSLQVAIAWHRALLRADSSELARLSTEDIVVDILHPVPMEGHYEGVDRVLQHGRDVVALYPLLDSSIVQVLPVPSGTARFVTQPFGINSKGEPVSNDRHLVHAHVRDGRVSHYQVMGYDGSIDR